MAASRRLSHVISEGEGISLLAFVSDAAGAAEAERTGADGIVAADVPGVREATGLPLLWRGEPWPEGVDGVVLVVSALDVEDGELERVYARALESGLEPVVEVRDEDELENALELCDPEILLLSGAGADADEEPLDRVLALLPDVPAGKLAVAEIPVTSRDEVLALERAGMDAVLVDATRVAEYAGAARPEV